MIYEILAVWLLGAALSVITGFVEMVQEDAEGNKRFRLLGSFVFALLWPFFLSLSCVYWIRKWLGLTK